MLVKEKILKPTVLQNNINSKHAHEAENLDWRYLNLAAFL